MLIIEVVGGEYYDDVVEKFYVVSGSQLRLEHSLLSVSKWEAKWEKPFLGTTSKSQEETIDYVRCMTVTRHDINPDVYKILSQENLDAIGVYIGAPMTATTFQKSPDHSGARETITNELIYYWMFSNQIPKECEQWHLNRLLTLIKVFSIKNTPPKKTMGRRALLSRNATLNAERRQKHNSKG